MPKEEEPKVCTVVDHLKVLGASPYNLYPLLVIREGEGERGWRGREDGEGGRRREGVYLIKVECLADVMVAVLPQQLAARPIKRHHNPVPHSHLLQLKYNKTKQCELREGIERGRGRGRERGGK